MREKTEKGGWKVGELAARTSISVRTLHHYDEIDLLSPSGRTESGHRLYYAVDVLRLQQIRSLKVLGLSLEEIKGCLKDESFSVQRVIRMHVAGVKERIRLLQGLLRRLETVEERLHSAETSSAGELVSTAMEVMEMSERIEKYYSPEQLEYLEKRKREVGQERIREVEAEWPRLMEQVRAEMEAGTDPADERVQKLAERWMRLVKEFTGGDPGTTRSVGNMWRQEENVHGIDTGEMREMMDYISRVSGVSNRPG